MCGCYTLFDSLHFENVGGRKFCLYFIRDIFNILEFETISYHKKLPEYSGFFMEITLIFC